jgi:hypothetical protein
MPDYSQGKIYKIVGNGLTYYGSTCQSLSKRFQEHKTDYKQYICDEGNYITSFETGYKRYYNENKDNINEYKRDWREKNKVRISEERKIMGNCEICGREMRKDSVSRHKKRWH